VVPCHRAIGSDHRLVGYAGGLDRKRWLLQHEATMCGFSEEDTEGSLTSRALRI